jgi:hypothetical protein
MTAKIDHSRFVALLGQRFPRIAEAIADCATGLLHPEMATFGRATIGAIREGDLETVKAHFAFADELYRDGDDAVVNAVNVSYLELVDFEGRKAKGIRARQLLSPRLQQAVRDLEEYWDALRRSGKV